MVTSKDERCTGRDSPTNFCPATRFPRESQLGTVPRNFLDHKLLKHLINYFKIMKSKIFIQLIQRLHLPEKVATPDHLQECIFLLIIW